MSIFRPIPAQLDRLPPDTNACNDPECERYHPDSGFPCNQCMAQNPDCPKCRYELIDVTGPNRWHYCEWHLVHHNRNDNPKPIGLIGDPTPAAAPSNSRPQTTAKEPLMHCKDCRHDKNCCELIGDPHDKCCGCTLTPCEAACPRDLLEPKPG